MRAVVITKHGGPGVLAVQERPDPPIGPGEGRIAVAAAGINFADVLARVGLYQDAPQPPCGIRYGGGVGIAATQIAKRTGAEVYGTASPSKHDRIRELGVDRALDYTRPGWDRDIGSFDVILDAVGGKSFRRSYELLRPGGRLVAFGATSVLSGERRNLLTALRTVARMPRFNMIKQMSESKAVIGLNMLTLWKDRGSLQPWIGPLQELLRDGTVKPVVAGAFPFEEAGAAHSMLVERRNLGKVVLTP